MTQIECWYTTFIYKNEANKNKIKKKNKNKKKKDQIQLVDDLCGAVSFTAMMWLTTGTKLCDNDVISNVFIGVRLFCQATFVIVALWMKI